MHSIIVCERILMMQPSIYIRFPLYVFRYIRFVPSCVTTIYFICSLDSSSDKVHITELCRVTFFILNCSYIVVHSCG